MPSLAPPPTANHSGSCFSKAEHFQRMLKELKQVFRVKKLVGRRGAPELELLAVVIVLFAPILHESLTNSNFVTNTI